MNETSKDTLPPYEYYYEYTKEQVAQLSTMPYRDALLHKIESAKALLRKLLHKPFQAQDSTRINDVLKAIKFNHELLKELE